MTTKNVFLSFVIFLIYACGGNDKVPPTQNHVLELSMKDQVFIFELETN